MISKTRACYNCGFYEHRGLSEIPIGERDREVAFIKRGDGLPAAVPAIASYAPRCVRGLNPALAHAPDMSSRIQGKFVPDEMAAFCDFYRLGPLAFPMLRKALSFLRSKHGETFSTEKLSLQFAPYFEKGSTMRIKVKPPWSETVSPCGYVSISGGPVPAFLLMQSVKAVGSRNVLTDEYKIVAVRSGGKNGRYRELEAA